ncbi:MAG: hypothetical protein K8R02_07485 [Anaerohalosphaeraceae bacterium]|nr:hypothetical protein [Anaerohalosphaeraceae bacterium]
MNVNFRQTTCISLLFIIFFAGISFAKYSGGSGTEADPYKLADANDLLDLAADTNDYNDCFILINDINLANHTFTTAVIAPDTSPYGDFDGIPFNGIFDGNNRSIINLTIDINDTGNDYIGLFGQLQQNGVITRVSLNNIYVTGGNWNITDSSYFIAGLCGYNLGLIIESYADGYVNSGDWQCGCCGYNWCTIPPDDSFSSHIGFICGYNFEGYIMNCSSNGEVVGSENIGGICGFNEQGNIQNCLSKGITKGRENVGGLCGYNKGGNINKCYSNTTVIADEIDGSGLCSINDAGTISNCYSTGSVTGYSRKGGFCSLNGNDGLIKNCYSTSQVTSYGSVGASGEAAFCGGDYCNSIIDCYFLDTAGLDNGLGTPLTDAQMKIESSFIDWDFSYTDGDEADWFMAWGAYPILPWQISPVDLYTDGKNNLADFSVFASYWLREDCGIYNDYCEFSDMDFDGDTDIDDLYELMQYWLEIGIYN